MRPGVAIGNQAWLEISLRTLKVSGENRGPAPLVERVVLTVLRCAVGIKMGFHGHSNALDIDPMISARAAHALRVDMTGVAVARCTGQSTPARDPNMPDAPTFGRYAEIPYDPMTPEHAPNGPITLASFVLCTSLTPSRECIGGASCNGHACDVDPERAAGAGGDHGIDVVRVRSP